MSIQTKSSRIVTRLPLLLFWALASAPSLAYNFDPTEAEFQAWPTHCKVVYVRTTIGRASKFTNRITSSDIAIANRSLGTELFGGAGIHHHCAGSAILNRARSEQSEVRKARMLNRARAETEYTFERIDSSHALFAQNYIQMATILFEQDNQGRALSVLAELRLKAPSNSTAYTASAVIHSKRNDYEKALQILNEGNRRLAGKSPEIHYNLGLVHLELGDPLKATQHAKAAYKGGYPLPGLRMKLARAGHWK